MNATFPSKAAAFIAAILVLLVSFGSVYNTDVAKENYLAASLTDYQNALTTTVNTMRSEGFIVTSQMDAAKAIVDRQARAGEIMAADKLALAFQQANVPIPQDAATKLVAIISSGYNLANQKASVVIDASRELSRWSSSFPQNVMLGVMGLPKVDPSVYKPYLASDVSDAARTGVFNAPNPLAQ